MTVAALLDEARSLGANLRSVSGRLRVDAPAGVLTDGFRAELAARRAEVLALLDEGMAEPIPGPSDRTWTNLDDSRTGPEHFVPPDAAWSAPMLDWPREAREHWQERAAIREFEGSLPRAEAEALACVDLARSELLAEGPSAYPWRSIVADWPLDRRAEWGRLANIKAGAGRPFPLDEAEAFSELAGPPGD